MPFDLPPPDPGLEISLASRGYSKGVAQTEDVQIVVRPELAFGDFQLGAYAKNVDSSDYDGEAGVNVGLKKTFGKTDLAATATVKHALDSRPGIDETALELSGSAAHAFGRFKPRVAVTYSPNELAGTGRSIYWEAGAGYQFAKRFNASAGVGRRERTGGPDYTSFNAGVTYTIRGTLTADLRWYDTNRSDIGDNYEGRFVAALRAKI